MFGGVLFLQLFGYYVSFTSRHAQLLLKKNLPRINVTSHHSMLFCIYVANKRNNFKENLRGGQVKESNYGLFTLHTFVAFSASCKWLPKGITVYRKCSRLVQHACINTRCAANENRKEKRVLFIFTLHFRWKPSKTPPPGKKNLNVKCDSYWIYSICVFMNTAEEV